MDFVSAVKRIAGKAWAAWESFWFSPVSLTRLARFRLALGLILFFMVAPRQWAIEELFSDAGWIGREQALLAIPEVFRPSWSWALFPDAWAGPLHLLLLVSLLLISFGWGRWLPYVLAWPLLMAFIQRNYTVVFGADVIATLFLLYLTMTRPYRGSVRPGASSQWTPAGDLLAPVFFRLIQIQLCVIYFYSGLEKLKGPSWWEGSALWLVFSNPQMTLFDLSFMRFFPTLLAVGAFLTILFELYFPVLVWFQRWRRACLLVGIFFHAGIALSLGLFSFAATMLAPYLLFWPPSSRKKGEGAT